MTAPAGPIGRLIQLVPTREQLDRYWLDPIDASTMVLVRTLYGTVALLWMLSLLPDFDVIFLSDGFAADRRFSSTTLLTLFRWADADAVFIGAAAVMIISSAGVVFGRNPRLTVPVTGFLHISFIDASQPWGIGGELTMVLCAVYLSAFALLTPNRHQGHFADHAGSRGLVPQWGLRLMQIQIAVAYLSTSASKLNGTDWRDGSATFHALEADQLQRFDAPAFMTDYALSIRALTWSVLLVELVLCPLLLWPRTRRFAVILALSLHIGIEIFLELGFFAASMSILILSFLAARDARSILDRLPRRRRAASV